MGLDRAPGNGGSKQVATGSAGAAPAAAAPGKRTLTEDASGEAPAGKTVGNGGGGGGGGAPAAGNSTTVNGIQISASQLPGVGGGRTRVGAGEDVMFSTAGRGGRWSAARSISASTYPGNDRTTFLWKAPATPGEVEIRYEPESGEARVVTMTVVAPDSVVFAGMQELPAARAGANMNNKVVVGLRDRPTPDVSFAGLQWKEQGGGDAAAPKAVTGYFERYRAMGGDLVHHPESAWIAIDENLNDSAGIEGLPPVEQVGGQPRWAQGSFHWDIPNKYKVDGAGDEHLIENVKQEFEIKPSGEVTVKKGYPRGGQTHVKLSTTRATATADTGTSAREADAKLDAEGLELLVLRMRDALDDPTRQTYERAISRRTPPMMKLILECVNKYSWVTSDAVRIRINDKPPTQLAAFSISSGTQQYPMIPLLTVFPLNELANQGRSLAVNVEIVIEDKTFHMTFATPFQNHPLSAIDGSEDRYKIGYDVWHAGARGPAAPETPAAPATPTP